MAISIDQRPLYNVLPIGQQVIFSVSQDQLVATKFNVKFIAEVHISNTAIVPGTTPSLIGTFKTTPNNAGVGIFDLRPILETFVSPDYEPNATTFPSSTSEYKGITAIKEMFPMHLVDKYSVSVNSIKFFAIRFRIEYSETANDPITIDVNEDTDSDQYTMFNGVLQYDDTLKLLNGNYGYDLDNAVNSRQFYLYYYPANFLSNAPTTQYARDTDYGTFPFFNFLPDVTDRVPNIRFTAYNSSGVAFLSNTLSNAPYNGGTWSFTTHSYNYLQYVGVFPANIRQWNTVWDAAFTAGTIKYYTVQALNVGGSGVSDTYTINITCPNERGYEGIRLTWLNQWGTWDYYTFNMKSIRSIETNRTSYTQQGGTWNESTFKIKGYKGGKKNFRVNSTEKIKLNTDFVTEEEGVWFEELINSNEVYIVNEYSTDSENSITNKYIEPVVLTTSSYVKKTIANDKLMQYTIEIEKSKMKRTQAV